MGNTWIVDLTHFLDEKGTIAPPKGPARQLAEYIHLQNIKFAVVVVPVEGRAPELLKSI